MMLGQASIAEYLVLVLMIVFIAFMALLMIFGFQFFSVGSEQTKSLERRSLFLLESAISTTALNNLQYQQGSVLDDSKLTAATCEDLETLLGKGWYAEVRAIPDDSVCDDMPRYLMNACLKNLRLAAGTSCTTQNYPDCNVWEFCQKNERDRMMYRSIPVNIYRKMNGTLQLGVLTIGVQAVG
ncbi:MAG: hypothetical protein JXC85_03345 [Candidatus Aenigmarchaeota archaeon]|nr:hypothetical protein [Candidatus Aenigmarchaeota archaeon]